MSPTEPASETSPGDFDLAEILRDRFNASLVMRYLLLGKESFPGEKDLALAAFHRWALFPRQDILIEKAVLNLAAEKISAFGKDGRQPPRGLLTLFHQLGGIDDLAVGPWIGPKRGRNVRISAAYAARLVGVVHWQLMQTDLKPPSIRGATAAHADALSAMPLKSRGARRLDDAWHRYAPSLSFLYAELTMSGDGSLPAADLREDKAKHFATDSSEPDRPLILFYTNPEYVKVKRKFRRLAARAFFVQEQILRQMPVQRQRERQFLEFPTGLKQEQFPPPTFSAEEETKLRGFLVSPTPLKS